MFFFFHQKKLVEFILVLFFEKRSLKEMPGNFPHSLGRFLLQMDVDGRKFVVVDGQQRLTTIMTLLCALGVVARDTLSEKC